MLVLEKQEKNGEEKFFAIVQLIGSRKQTLQFAYRCVFVEMWRRLFCYIQFCKLTMVHKIIGFALVPDLNLMETEGVLSGKQLRSQSMMVCPQLFSTQTACFLTPVPQNSFRKTATWVLTLQSRWSVLSKEEIQPIIVPEYS